MAADPQYGDGRPPRFQRPAILNHALCQNCDSIAWTTSACG